MTIAVTEKGVQTMKYENMPKGRNKDICVRCGKRANFADRLKSDVQYDLLCLAETTSSGYKTHGNVKLCGKCMSELLMWLDADDFCPYGCRITNAVIEEKPTPIRDYMVCGERNCSEKPNNCKDCKWWFGYCHLEECEYEPKDEPQTERSE